MTLFWLPRPATHRVTTLQLEQLETRLAPAGGVVSLDAAWLARHGPAPYLLDQPDTTYLLQKDVSVPGTAFVVAAPHVTLDLNGHTVLFGNQAYPNVANGGFEQGTGARNVPGWDLHAAPTAQRAPARTGMWGQWMLSLNNFTSAQQIVSNPVPISAISQDYVATITPRVDTANTVQSVLLQVVDAVTGQVLASGTSRNPGRGYGIVVPFTPTNRDAVRLRVTVTPDPGVKASADLDYAGLFPTNDYGVVATTTWRGDLPTQLQGLPKSYRTATDVTIRNGHLVQGDGRAARASAIFARALTGLTVDHVDSSVNGLNAENLNGSYAGNVTIRNSTFRSSIDLITDRQIIFAAVYLGGLSGPALVQGNTISNAPMDGIFADGNPAGAPVTITGNTIEQRALVADGYGVSINNLQDFRITHNVIHPLNGRGLLIDGWNDGISRNGEIANNDVTAYERPNLEYPASQLEATALRLRNYNGQHRNLNIHDNTFSASTGPGSSWAAIGAQITQDNHLGQMNAANDLLHNNVFEALASSAAPTSRAFALVLSGVDGGTGLRVTDNVLRSNDTALSLGMDGALDPHVEDVLLTGNRLVRVPGTGQRAFTGILVGYLGAVAHNIRLLDTQYVEALASPPVFTGTAAQDVETGSLLTVLVHDQGGRAVAGAGVSILNAGGKVVGSGVTDAAGRLLDLPVVTTTYQQTPGNSGKVVQSQEESFTVVVTAGGHTAGRSVTLLGNTTVSVSLTA